MRIRKPVRATRTFTQSLVAPSTKVLPLLCPVREADWIEGWDPIDVWSNGGVVEPDCVFTTRAGDGTAVWHVTRFDTKCGFVEMLKVTPGVTSCRLIIQLKDVGPGSEATITYAHTSLGTEAGDAFVASFTDAYYAGFMRDWESRMNHYLETGGRLPE